MNSMPGRWEDTEHRRRISGSGLGDGFDASPRSARPCLVTGDGLPGGDPAPSFARLDKQHRLVEEGREPGGRGPLSPVWEDDPTRTAPSDPALVVHVDIRFTDPVIRTRYGRSYESSPELNATPRICRGLVRRIERCAEELVTRKDSSALDVFKRDSFDRKPQRYEITFRVSRRARGDWAERSYRSYQKQPLTMAQARDVVLTAHRIVGLFLLRHDRGFRWLDGPAPDAGLPEAPETAVPSRGNLPSLSCVPPSRFIEATQTFEFVPGYDIHVGFRSTNPHRHVPTLERSFRVSSTQPAPLTLLTSEDLLRKAQKVVNDELARRWRQVSELPIPFSNDALEVRVRVVNNLGHQYDHVRADVTSTLPLFRDDEGKDCDAFLAAVEQRLGQVRTEADKGLKAANDLEFRIVELKGIGWTAREPARFAIGPAVSHGRQTVQAALERLQTGVGDVIRGHNLAIHIRAQKRGHVVLDKAIVAHEKRGKPRERFGSREDEQAVMVARLKARVQADMDKIFEDSCCIDDIPEEEEEEEEDDDDGDDDDDNYSTRPATAKTLMRLEQAFFDGPSRDHSPSSSARSTPPKHAKAMSLAGLHHLPRSRSQRVFSLSSRSTESVRSIDYLKPGRYSYAESDISRHSTAESDQMPRQPNASSPMLDRASLELRRPVRAFSLGSKGSTLLPRLGNTPTLPEQSSGGVEGGGPIQKAVEAPLQIDAASHGVRPMTSAGERALRAASSRCTLESTSRESLGVPAATKKCERSPRNATAGFTTPVAAQPRHTVMETPEFVDAREYPSSPAPQEIAAVAAKADFTSALPGTPSPRDDDEYSTAPTTPELSVGASSTGPDVAGTPVLLRAASVAKDGIPTLLYPEPEGREDPETASIPRPTDSIADAIVDNDHLTTPLPSHNRDWVNIHPVLPPPATAAGDGDAAPRQDTPTPPGPAPLAPSSLLAETQPAPRSCARAVGPVAYDTSTTTALRTSRTLQNIIELDRRISEQLAPAPGTEDDTPHVPELALDFPVSQPRTPNLDARAGGAADLATGDAAHTSPPVENHAYAPSVAGDASPDAAASTGLGPDTLPCLSADATLCQEVRRADDTAEADVTEPAAAESSEESVVETETADASPETTSRPGGQAELEDIGNEKEEKETFKLQELPEARQPDDALQRAGDEELHPRTWAEVAAAGSWKEGVEDAGTVPAVGLHPPEETEGIENDAVGVGLVSEVDAEGSSGADESGCGSEDVPPPDAVSRVDGEAMHLKTWAEVTASGNPESETVVLSTAPAAEVEPVDETEDAPGGDQRAALVPEMNAQGSLRSYEGTEEMHTRTWAEVAAAGNPEMELGDAGAVPSIGIGPGEGTESLDGSADGVAFVPETETDVAKSSDSGAPLEGDVTVPGPPEEESVVARTEVLGSDHDHAAVETAAQTASGPAGFDPDAEAAQETGFIPKMPNEPNVEPSHATTETTIKSEPEPLALGPDAQVAEEPDLALGVRSEQAVGAAPEYVESRLEDEKPPEGCAVASGPEVDAAKEATAMDSNDRHDQTHTTGEWGDDAGNSRVSDVPGSVPEHASDSGLAFHDAAQERKHHGRGDFEESGGAPTGLGIIGSEVWDAHVEIRRDATAAATAAATATATATAGEIGTSVADNVPETAGSDAFEPESPDSGVAGMDKDYAFAILHPTGNEARGAGGDDKLDLRITGPPAAQRQEGGGELASAVGGSAMSDDKAQILPKEPKILNERQGSAGNETVDGASADSDGGGASEESFGPEGGALRPIEGFDGGHKVQLGQDAELTTSTPTTFGIAKTGVPENLEAVSSLPSNPDDSAPAVSADASATPPATPKLAEPASPPRHRQNSVPLLAPVPDLSKLGNLYPITPESPTSLRSFDASQSTPGIVAETQPRDSVDSVRSVVEELPQQTQQPHRLAAPQPPPSSIPSTRSSSPCSRRPQTRGYLGVGLGLGLSLGPKGLAHRRSRLDLHGGVLDNDDDDDDTTGSAYRQVSLLLHSPKLQQGQFEQQQQQRHHRPSHEAGGGRRKPDAGGAHAKAGPTKKHGDDEHDGRSDEASVLPRMMVLLAGAVAVGKMLTGPG
ncbi:hypothetical protein VTJ83DRAFT_685 [Remersonia thermophila]|uniref:Pt repeat family protein n=1 Tax=Remersonia thermophila TaxID=72144 RepID=A0ABR4DLP0_9PEZI